MTNQINAILTHQLPHGTSEEELPVFKLSQPPSVQVSTVQQGWSFKHGPEPVGAVEGLPDGPLVGLFVGTCVGLVVGGDVGRNVITGLPVGDCVGPTVGARVGFLDGLCVGVPVGPLVGVTLGGDSAAPPTMALIEPSEVLLES